MKSLSGKFVLLVLLMLSLFSASSCDEIADEVFDCIINKSPVLSQQFLRVGQVGVFYSDDISAEIQNEPNDNDYYYYFDIHGSIPNGIEVIIEPKSVVFEGIPTEAGRLDITIDLTVVGPEYWDEESQSWSDELCSYQTSETYTMRINDKP